MKELIKTMLDGLSFSELDAVIKYNMDKDNNFQQIVAMARKAKKKLQREERNR